MLDVQKLAEEIYAELWRTKYVPAAAAAAEEEASRRIEHFVDAPRPVGPWRLRPLTLRDMLLAEGYENPLIAPAEIAVELARPEQLAWFAWLLQTEAPVGDIAARDAFIAAATRRHFRHERRRRFLRPAALVPTAEPAPEYFQDLAEAVEFVTFHLADGKSSRVLDPRTGRPRPSRDSGTHWIAGIVDALGCEYGWHEADILDLHLGRVWQYMRRIEQRHRPEALVPSRVKQLEGDCLAETQRLLAERLAAEAGAASAARTETPNPAP